MGRRPQASNVDNFQSLFDFLPVGAYRSLPDGRMLRANAALVRLNGCDSEAELIAMVRDIAVEWYVDPARRAEFKALLERDDRVVGFESAIYRHKSRERIWVRENAHVVRHADGSVHYYEGTVEEITDQVNAREIIGRSQARLQQLVQLIPGVVFHVAIAPDGFRRYTYVSDAVRELYGLTPEEVLADGNALTRMRHPDEAAQVAALAKAAIDQDRALNYEVRALLRNGQQKWVQVISAPAPSDVPGGRARVGVLFDITNRKRAEVGLQAQADLWKNALEATGDGVWDWRVQEGVEILSPQCKALYGFEPDELPDTPDALDQRTHPDDKPRMAQDREAHFAGRTARYVNEHRVRCKDGTWKWILSRGLVISRDAQGAPLRMVGTHTDITAAKEAEALRIERDRAAAADLAKSQFLSRVSHELRTPLNAILGFAQLLELDPGNADRQQGWNRQVLASGRHLLALMDDILDMSSVQTGHMTVLREPVPLRPVVDEAWVMVHSGNKDQEVSLLNELPPGADEQALGDRKRIKQIVSNLLSNAVKYNRPQGWVRVTMQAQGPDWALSVADSGPGLDAEQQSRLFRAFDRLGAERSTVPGTGLGLALSRQLAQAMGGDISVQSAPGQGSCFTLRLPRA